MPEFGRRSCPGLPTEEGTEGVGDASSRLPSRETGRGNEATMAPFNLPPFFKLPSSHASGLTSVQNHLCKRNTAWGSQRLELNAPHTRMQRAGVTHDTYHFLHLAALLHTLQCLCLLVLSSALQSGALLSKSQPPMSPEALFVTFAPMRSQKPPGGLSCFWNSLLHGGVKDPSGLKSQRLI